MSHHRALFRDRSLLNFAVGVLVLACPLIGSTRVAAGDAKRDPGESLTSAELLIDEAIRRIARLDFVIADIAQDGEMLNEIVALKGTYLKAPGARFTCGSPPAETPTPGSQRFNIATARHCGITRKSLTGKSSRG